MALSASQLSEANAIAVNYIYGSIPDILTKANYGLKMFYDNKQYVSGGPQIQVAIQFAANSSIGSINGAFEPIDTNENQQLTYGTLDWKFQYQNVSITLKDNTFAGDTRQAIKSLVEAKVAATKADMARYFSTMIHSSGTSSNKQWNGFPDMFAASGTAYMGLNDTDVTNWLPIIDTTSQVVTYPVVASMIRRLRGRTQTVGVTASQFEVDTMISNSAVMQAYMDTLQSQQRFVETKKLESGFEGITVNGVDWYVDENAAGSADGSTADNYLYVITSKSMKLFHKDGFDGKSPFDQNIQLASQPVKSSQVFFSGNVGCVNRYVNGVFKTLIA